MGAGKGLSSLDRSKAFHPSRRREGVQVFFLLLMSVVATQPASQVAFTAGGLAARASHSFRAWEPRPPATWKTCRRGGLASRCGGQESRGVSLSRSWNASEDYLVDRSWRGCHLGAAPED